MSADYILEPERIRQIQSDELSAIEGLSLTEIQARIDYYQTTSRECELRLRKCSEKLSERLRAKDNDELEGLIEHIPSAERILVDRRGFPKPKAPTVGEKIRAKAKAEAKHNPLMAELLAELSAAKLKKD